jgi:tetratricopeptide (TPR) repeat protein
MAGMALCQTNFGLLHLRRGELEQADDPLWSALQLRQMLADKHLRLPQYRVELAASHDALGQLFEQRGEFDNAASAYRDALLIREPLRNEFRDEPQYEVSLAASHNSLGALYRDHGQFEQAADSFSLALEILERVAATHPEVFTFRQHVAGAQHNLADAQHSAGKLDEALVSAKKAVALRRELLTDPRSTDDDRSNLADSIDELATILAADRKIELALAAYGELLPLRRQLATADDAALEDKLSAAAAGVRYGVLLASQEKLDAARTEFTAAIQSLDACGPDERDAPQLNQLLQIALATRSQVYDALAQHDKAIDDWDELLTLCSSAEKPRYTLRRAVSLARSGKHAAAVAEVAPALAENSPIDPQLALQALCVYSRAIEAAAVDPAFEPAMRKETAEKYLQSALAILEPLVANPDAGEILTLLQQDQDLRRLNEEAAVKSLLAKRNDTPEPAHP